MLQSLHKGHLVMADKGFLIKDQLARFGARLAISYFYEIKGNLLLWNVN